MMDEEDQDDLPFENTPLETDHFGATDPPFETDQPLETNPLEAGQPLPYGETLPGTCRYVLKFVSIFNGAQELRSN